MPRNTGNGNMLYIPPEHRPGKKPIVEESAPLLTSTIFRIHKVFDCGPGLLRYRAAFDDTIIHEYKIAPITQNGRQWLEFRPHVLHWRPVVHLYEYRIHIGYIDRRNLNKGKTIMSERVFLCPLTVNGQSCGRRARTLYLPLHQKYMGCQACHRTIPASRGSSPRAILRRQGKDAPRKRAAVPGGWWDFQPDHPEKYEGYIVGLADGSRIDRPDTPINPYDPMEKFRDLIEAGQMDKATQDRIRECLIKNWL